MSTHKPSREEIALVEVGQTDISPGTARWMVGVFLALIIAVPVWDVIVQWRRGEPLTALALLRSPPRIADFTPPVHRGRTPEHNPLHVYESSLEQASDLRSAVQRHVQSGLTGLFHGGSGKVLRGKDDWLFWRPGLDAVAGRGFLTAERQAIAPRFHRDPRAAIAAVDAACRAAGARLLVLPIPDKITVHPQHLSRSFAATDTPRNPDDLAFLAWLDAQSIAHLDVLPQLKAGGDTFLRQDTHWTPAAMDAVAVALAGRVRELAGDLPEVTWTSGSAEVARVGDLVDALKLPAGQATFAAQAVTIAPVSGAAGPWASDLNAPVLLLGDSFTNIFTAGAMGWGDAAGLGPRLAYHGRCAVDQLAINGGGASGALKELAKRQAPLAGKRIVIWEFAARDLAVEDWPIIPLRTGEAAPPAPPASPAGDLEVVVELLSPMPSLAGSDGAQYTQARAVLNTRVISVVRGTWTAPELLITIPVIDRSKRTRAAAMQPGQRYRLVLSPTVPTAWDGVQVLDDTGIYDPPLWAADAEPAP